MLAKRLGKRRLHAPAPVPFVRIATAVMQAVLPRPPITTAALTLFSFENIANINAVEQDFGFKPMSWRVYLAEHGAD